MKNLSLAVFLALVACAFDSGASADNLHDYKNQKHGERKKVTDESCQDDYKADCKSKCNGDAACIANCDATAAKFCEDRGSRRTEKIWETVGKGATLGVGAIGILLDDKIPEVKPGETPLSEYAIIWNNPSFNLDLGGGFVQAGAKILGFWGSYRHSWFGASGSLEYLWQAPDHLFEGDFGPTLYLVSAHIMAGFQPSMLISGGNGVETRYGPGLRALNTYVNGQFMVGFDPILGYINQQWYYQLRASVAYRFTPLVYARLAFEHRDILDLNDLNISNTGLESMMFYIGLRFN